ncbi:MAG TPA: ThuA domain-containing protein [Flavitalea sp.]|nr:ThuA domain-containing protein [Flavitalea sp.]
MNEKKRYISAFVFLMFAIVAHAQSARQKHIVAFFTGREDLAHISFLKEAVPFFADLAKRNNFLFDTTTNWTNLNDEYLKSCDLILFLDTRPDDAKQRLAFRKYMEHGGAWMGFHFAGFALTPSDFPMNWDWYHRTFLGSGAYKGNTWRPTMAVLNVEDSTHPVLQGLGQTFISAPNEWYSWEEDLRKNKAIKILLSIHPSSFPLGTGPKPHEIWHDGFYPVAWSNRNYRMIYFNVGHNDMDYGGTNKTLSSTFSSPAQNRFIEQSIRWLLNKARKN